MSTPTFQLDSCALLSRTRPSEGAPQWTTRLESMNSIRRNGWTACLGIGGRHAPEAGGGWRGSVLSEPHPLSQPQLRSHFVPDETGGGRDGRVRGPP